MFSKIQYRRPNNRDPVSGVNVSRNKSGFCLTIGADVAQATGLKAKDRVDVLWGSMDDAGRVRIEFNANGHRGLMPANTNTGALCMTNVVQPEAMPKHLVKSCSALAVEVERGAVTFTMPMSFYLHPRQAVADGARSFVPAHVAE